MTMHQSNRAHLILGLILAALCVLFALPLVAEVPTSNLSLNTNADQCAWWRDTLTRARIASCPRSDNSPCADDMFIGFAELRIRDNCGTEPKRNKAAAFAAGETPSVVLRWPDPPMLRTSLPSYRIGDTVLAAPDYVFYIMYDDRPSPKEFAVAYEDTGELTRYQPSEIPLRDGNTLIPYWYVLPVKVGRRLQDGQLVRNEAARFDVYVYLPSPDCAGLCSTRVIANRRSVAEGPPLPPYMSPSKVRAVTK